MKALTPTPAPHPVILWTKWLLMLKANNVKKIGWT